MPNDFAVDIRKFVEKVKDREALFARELAQDLARKVIERTPVETGFLRGSWYASINNIAKTNNGRKDSSGAAALSTITLTFQNAKAGDTLYILNNANYARRIEFGFVGMTDSLGRFYTGPAPRAMVRRTIAEADEIAKQVLVRLGTP